MAKFSSCRAQNPALTRRSSASALSFASLKAPGKVAERRRTPAGRYRCSAAPRHPTRCPAGSCRARGGEEEEEQPCARAVPRGGTAANGSCCLQALPLARFPSWLQLGCRCCSHQARGNREILYVLLYQRCTRTLYVEDCGAFLAKPARNRKAVPSPFPPGSPGLPAQPRSHTGPKAALAARWSPGAGGLRWLHGGSVP